MSQPLNLYEMTLAAAVTCTSFGTWKFRTFQNFGKYTRPRECREEHSFQWVSKELKFSFESLLLQLPKLKKRSRSTKKFWWLLEVLLSSLKNLLNMFLDFLTPLAPYGRTTKPWLKSHCKYLRPHYDGIAAIHRTSTMIACSWLITVHGSNSQDQK